MSTPKQGELSAHIAQMIIIPHCGMSRRVQKQCVEGQSENYCPQGAGILDAAMSGM